MSEPVIGLEIHVQLKTRSKLFCSCSTNFKNRPNTNICPVCTGLPGALPVVNSKAVEQGVRVALALNMKVNRVSTFDRKNYFYPDLPSGYQITQQRVPLAQNGSVSVFGRDIKIAGLHIENDAGKSVHSEGKGTLIDFNRSGIALAEIVTEPVIKSPEEAEEFLRKLREILVYTGVSDCNMQDGNFRFDGNISIRKGRELPDYKVEIKNVNSFRFLRKALEYEISVQKEDLAKNKKIGSCTKYWDETDHKTVLMRKKEKDYDYRFFPEPDLKDLILDQSMINEVSDTMPELPDTRRKRFTEQYKLDDRAADFYISKQIFADFFEKTAKLNKDYRKIDLWISNELAGIYKESEKIDLTPHGYAAFIDLLVHKEIDNSFAKEIFSDFAGGKSLKELLKKRKKAEISESEISDMVKKLIYDHSAEVNKYRNGNKQISRFFIGRIMGMTKGQANPETVSTVVHCFLDNE